MTILSSYENGFGLTRSKFADIGQNLVCDLSSLILKVFNIHN